MDELFLKLLLEAVKSWGWPGLIFVISVVLITNAWHNWPAIKARINPPFDTPIRDAISHWVSTYPHSYDRSSLAEREAFDRLYEYMCEGTLPVKGAPREGAKLQRIYRWKCRELQPVESLIPKNLASPEGVRYDLISRKFVEESQDTPSTRELVPGKDFIAFSGLMVRSSDLYRLWPKDKKKEAPYEST